MILAACGASTPVPQGDIAASLTVPALDPARPFDPRSLAGKPSLVMFVSPYCTHCLAELPRAQHAASEAGANIAVVFVVGKRENAAAFVKQARYVGPALFDDGTLKTAYDIRQVPYTLVLGSDGRARDAFLGEQSEDALLAAISRAP